MCYLITYFKPTKAGELSVIQTTVFEGQTEAMQAAEALLETGATEVTVWERLGTPSIRREVSWKLDRPWDLEAPRPTSKEATS